MNHLEKHALGQVRNRGIGCGLGPAGINLRHERFWVDSLTSGVDNYCNVTTNLIFCKGRDAAAQNKVRAIGDVPGDKEQLSTIKHSRPDNVCDLGLSLL